VKKIFFWWQLPFFFFKRKLTKKKNFLNFSNRPKSLHNCLQYEKLHKFFVPPTFLFWTSPKLNIHLFAIWETSQNWPKKTIFWLLFWYIGNHQCWTSIGFLTYPFDIVIWLFWNSYTMAIHVLGQKYKNSYQVISICTKFTFSHNGMNIMVLKCVILKGVHSFNMNMLV